MPHLAKVATLDARNRRRAIHSTRSSEAASEPRVLLSGLAYVESPRWHDCRLWFAHWGTDEIVAVDMEGLSEVTGRGPGGLGWSIDWTAPRGDLLVTGPGLTRAHDGVALAPYADLSHLADDWNELVVDGRGNAYVNGRMFGPPDAGPSGIVALVTPDGEVRQVAGGFAFPNGMVVTPDGRTLIVAESWAEQLTAFDIEADGLLAGRRVWAATPGDHPDASAWTRMARCGSRTSAMRTSFASVRAARCSRP